MIDSAVVERAMTRALQDAGFGACVLSPVQFGATNWVAFADSEVSRSGLTIRACSAPRSRFTMEAEVMRRASGAGVPCARVLLTARYGAVEVMVAQRLSGEP